MTASESSRKFGILMIAASASVVFFMAHHPTSPHQTSGIPGMVHGAMQMVLLALAIGFCHFAQRRHLTRLLVLSGLVCYLLSVVCNFGAATINGFVVPALAASDAEIQHAVFLLAWESNQALAELAVMLTGMAYLAWSIDLIRDPVPVNRLIGATGFLAGLLPAAALLLGPFSMDVHTALWIYSAHALWAAVVGVWLVRVRQPESA
ncbi:MAG: hypothetical protein QNJ40_16740 [Xanthomonadales bacterium]|nr:hypothetical protein [Xanthomonadales bacterium]